MVGGYRNFLKKKKVLLTKILINTKNEGTSSFCVHGWNPHGSHSCLETVLFSMFSFMSPRMPFETECYSQEVVITSALKNEMFS